MNLIAAVDINWAIGFRGDMLEHIPEDLKFFKESTIGKVVVMGRGTLESLPGKKPLPNRVNIILTRNKNFLCEGTVLCHSVNELFDELRKYKSEDIYIVGGDFVYSQLLPYCEYAYITEISKSHEADKFMVNLDEKDEWTVISEGETKHYEDLDFKFMTYKNTKVKNSLQQ